MNEIAPDFCGECGLPLKECSRRALGRLGIMTFDEAQGLVMEYDGWRVRRTTWPAGRTVTDDDFSAFASGRDASPFTQEDIDAEDWGTA